MENVQNKTFDSIVLAVKHKQFLSMSRDDFGKLLSSDGLFYDIKEVYRMNSKEFLSSFLFSAVFLFPARPSQMQICIA